MTSTITEQIRANLADIETCEKAISECMLQKEDKVGHPCKPDPPRKTSESFWITR